MKTNRKSLRVALLVMLIIGFFVIGRFTPIREYMTQEKLLLFVRSAGFWGAFIFVAAFVLGTVMQVPGLLFISLAVVIYGRYTGMAVAWIGAVAAVSVSFILVRALGGKALAEIKNPWVKKILRRLEAKPTFTVMVLRSVLLVNPPLTYALALSNIRFTDFLVGSTVGLVPPLIFVVFVLDAALGWLKG